jgi:NADPH:quinone reductase-like Zn-dependent oxidoreductase
MQRKTYRRDALKPNTLSLVIDLFENDVVLRPHEILIRIHAISLNYRDINILNGTNPWPTSATGVPCSDAAGSVSAVGSDVTRFDIGDRVSPIFDQKSITGQEQSRQWLGGEVDGVLATHVVFSEEKVVKIPEHLSWVEAACLPCAGLTAWSALAIGGHLVAGKTVLIQGKWCSTSGNQFSQGRPRNWWCQSDGPQACNRSGLQSNHNIQLRCQIGKGPKDRRCSS